MQNTIFDPQTLASELKAVIEEFRLYQDDYQGVVIEKMIESLGHSTHIARQCWA